MDCPNCADDMESNAYGVRASKKVKKVKKVTHTCSECGYSEAR
ncbi:hypothetical protein [Streptomyces aureocirculatus]|nr:hypothetical protein [Streptomyces aureocirculatus]